MRLQLSYPLIHFFNISALFIQRLLEHIFAVFKIGDLLLQGLKCRFFLCCH
ncbi:hypothetical protein D3C77_774840 [compost metagenome]